LIRNIPLFRLANTTNWSVFDDSFKKHYAEKTGKPAKPIRLMVSLFIMKYLRNLSDENLFDQSSENIYFQYFIGAQLFHPSIPYVATEPVAFRQRIGEEGMELILKESRRMNKADNKDKQAAIVSVDTTVQEKNITYPTDDKLYKKIIKKCRIVANKEHIDLTQFYRHAVRNLSNQQRFKHTNNGAKAARKASKKIKVIAAGCLGNSTKAAIAQAWRISATIKVVPKSAISKKR
jgi:IS5 family transposase